MKKLTLKTAMAVLLSCGATGAAAQTYPTQTVKIVVPFPAGGSTDVAARLVAADLARKWKQPVIVENRPGAGGTIFSEQLARSAPDGYTLMVTATHHVINPAIYKNIKYDTRTAFTPLALVTSMPNVLVAHPGFEPKTVGELVRYAKASPGKVGFGSSGAGGANHLSGELFKSMAGVDIVHIPYKGASPALNDVLAGQIPLMFASLPDVVQHIKSGKLKALAVTSLQRTQLLPNVPTMDEAGIKGFDATAWFGLYGPANMPAELKNRVHDSVLESVQSPAVSKQLVEMGTEPGAMSLSQFSGFVNAELDKWAHLIAGANLKFD